MTRLVAVVVDKRPEGSPYNLVVSSHVLFNGYQPALTFASPPGCICTRMSRLRREGVLARCLDAMPALTTLGCRQTGNLPVCWFWRHPLFLRLSQLTSVHTYHLSPFHFFPTMPSCCFLFSCVIFMLFSCNYDLCEDYHDGKAAAQHPAPVAVFSQDSLLGGGHVRGGRRGMYVMARLLQSRNRREKLK